MSLFTKTLKQEFTRLLELEVDMEKIDNNIQLAFLGGMKAGLEALIHGLEVVKEV